VLGGHPRHDREGRDYDRGREQAAIDQEVLGRQGGEANQDHRDPCGTARGRIPEVPEARFHAGGPGQAHSSRQATATAAAKMGQILTPGNREVKGTAKTSAYMMATPVRYYRGGRIRPASRPRCTRNRSSAAG
jgi:hypothetical protein